MHTSVRRITILTKCLWNVTSLVIGMGNLFQVIFVGVYFLFFNIDRPFVYYSKQFQKGGLSGNTDNRAFCWKID